MSEEVYTALLFVGLACVIVWGISNDPKPKEVLKVIGSLFLVLILLTGIAAVIDTFILKSSENRYAINEKKVFCTQPTPNKSNSIQINNSKCERNSQ